MSFSLLADGSMSITLSFRTLITKKQTLKTFKTYLSPNHLPLRILSSRYFTSYAIQNRLPSQAHNLFDESSQQDLGQYNRLLFDCSRNYRNQEAIKTFLGIRRLNLPINASTFSCVFKVCGSLFDEVVGRQVHCQCVKFGFMEDISVGTSLVDMYMKTNNADDGSRVFDEMGERNVVSWTSLLSGYAQSGLNHMVLELFSKMLIGGFEPNPFTLATVAGALAHEGMGEYGVQLHSIVIKKGFQATTEVCNSLINMYLKSRMVGDARAIFWSMVDKNAVSWNGMIAGYATNGLDLEALKLFYLMRLDGVELTQSSFGPLIKMCGNLKELGFARQLHCKVLKDGFGFDQSIRTALMIAYCKCREMCDALKLFSMMQEVQNVVSSTAMITGYLQNGEKGEAVNLFRQVNREGIRPNHFTYSAVLTAVPIVSPFQIHAHVIKANYEKFPTVGTALLDAYVKLGNTKEAAKVFELIDEKDIVAWSALLSGYAQIGETEEAVKTFIRLLKEGIKPNEFTFSSVINACATPTAAVEQGKQFHACSIKSRLNNALCVSSALVTMYAKRGNIESANEVFGRQGERDLVSWNSMICGHAQHGHANKALSVFEEMRKQNMEMDGITFIGIITACAHAGLVVEGERYFTIMRKDHQIDAKMEHYSCMVDLYSRAGRLEKAMNIINEMPFPAGATVWRTILAACRIHLNLELGKYAAEKLISLQPQDSAGYVLLSNIYATAGKWQERAEVRKLMDKRKVKKEAGYSWIEVKNKTYSFLAGDDSHPSSDQIYMKLEELSTRLKDFGYQPDTNYVLQDIDDEHKEVILSQHSERLAIAFGLIATPPGTSLQIVKNLRVCGDCHTVIKLITMIERREIVVRDTNRFHHFRGGICSCRDFW
ncbi:pentatricopeptide repeat-containing protein At2g27610 [Carica papaya]|uniref:pentatricopeptide repeat-containing protein At2g27610 n=1 Tax=Carica papaya TaxID=3649 RepID=UPI000B8CF209|nr:pentatricopeptide repeat-containing protein At2g27610 [Carica papaya]